MSTAPQSVTFARLLVPLDGSRLAEAVLPATIALAARFHSIVTLVHVLERNPPASIHGDRHLLGAPEAERYLEEMAGRLRQQGLRVETHVHEAPQGDIPRSVVDHAEEFAPDLVVLCAHGRGGLRGFLYGSIAQQVLQRGTRPVLLIQPGRDGAPAPFHPQRILVPLDGNVEHEGAAPLGAEIAHAFAAELDLVFVVPTLKSLSADRAVTAVWLPATTRALLDLDEQAAATYLAGIAAPWRGRGLKVQEEVLRGDTVDVLLRRTRRTGVDLVAMQSHGRVGLKGLLARSIARRVTMQAATPILLVRA